MAEQLHASTMPSVGWSGVKHAATGLWSSGNLICGVMNHTSLFGSLGLVDAKRTLLALLNCANCAKELCQLWRSCFSGVELGPFLSVMLNASAYQDILDNAVLPTSNKNSLTKAHFYSSMTVPQYTKQGP